MKTNKEEEKLSLITIGEVLEKNTKIKVGTSKTRNEKLVWLSGVFLYINFCPRNMMNGEYEYGSLYQYENNFLAYLLPIQEELEYCRKNIPEAWEVAKSSFLKYVKNGGYGGDYVSGAVANIHNLIMPHMVDNLTLASLYLAYRGKAIEVTNNGLDKLTRGTENLRSFFKEINDAKIKSYKILQEDKPNSDNHADLTRYNKALKWYDDMKDIKTDINYDEVLETAVNQSQREPYSPSSFKNITIFFAKEFLNAIGRGNEFQAIQEQINNDDFSCNAFLQKLAGQDLLKITEKKNGYPTYQLTPEGADFLLRNNFKTMGFDIAQSQNQEYCEKELNLIFDTLLKPKESNHQFGPKPELNQLLPKALPADEDEPKPEPEDEMENGPVVSEVSKQNQDPQKQHLVISELQINSREEGSKLNDSNSQHKPPIVCLDTREIKQKKPNKRTGCFGWLKF
jgi:hypothetical protein